MKGAHYDDGEDPPHDIIEKTRQLTHPRSEEKSKSIFKRSIFSRTLETWRIITLQKSQIRILSKQSNVEFLQSNYLVKVVFFYDDYSLCIMLISKDIQVIFACSMSVLKENKLETHGVQRLIKVANTTTVQSSKGPLMRPLITLCMTKEMIIIC